ncbi:hypothetical protein B9J07_27845 [Sinorhizobium sp. LM21]|uniref:hypothetical protein n=1 Tax=Sinorhizobium sp. LM21 TaxID=1449788 RepID=UPI0005D7D154|nr:hypothetical protein [Sinorhizobium sp. LM21]AJW30194.1 hypothetical protein pLM21S1_p74 [Sinorhizobium sp. LM21]OWZ90402.1 hypothetical protein B9J07_27845 [Sinorhizobium sp. LM21]
MTKDIMVYEVETLPDGRSTLQVISIEDTLAGQEYYVRLAEPGGDYADTPFEDYPQAYAHWRNTLRTLGIIVPYKAPTVQVGFGETGHAAAPARTWVEVYYEMHSQLATCNVGTEEATAVRDKFMADPEFKGFAAEIYIAAEGKTDWRNAIIRVACKRVMVKEKIESEQIMMNQLGSLSTFGAF